MVGLSSGLTARLDAALVGDSVVAGLGGKVLSLLVGLLAGRLSSGDGEEKGLFRPTPQTATVVRCLLET